MMTASATELIKQINVIKLNINATEALKPEAWLLRQELQLLCKKALLMNLEFSLDQRVEQDLWNFAFKSQISSLQGAAAGRKKGGMEQQRSGAGQQANLALFLESALGFYIQFVQELCTEFELSPPFRKKMAYFGVVQDRKVMAKRENFRLPEKSSCKYLIQHCLVHIGDLARYLQRTPLAESFYTAAAAYAPYNGQPYNQLAILSASRGDRLASVYFYVRSICVSSPFPVASTNLHKLYVKIVKDHENSNYYSKTKWTADDLLMAFLFFHALVHLESDLDRTRKMCDQLIKCLSIAGIFQFLRHPSCVHAVVVSLFTYHHCLGGGAQEGVGGASIPSANSLTRKEQHLLDVSMRFIVGFLEVLSLHMPKGVNKCAEYYGLPSIHLLLQWITADDKRVEHAVTAGKDRSVWTNLSRCFNNLQLTLVKTNEKPDLHLYGRLPLPEDLSVQSFLPFKIPHKALDFGSEVQYSPVDPKIALDLRCQRMVELGKVICDRYSSLGILEYTINTKTQSPTFSIPGPHPSRAAQPLRIIGPAAGSNNTATTPVNKERKFSRSNVAIQAIMQRKMREAAQGMPIGGQISPLGGQSSSIGGQGSSVVGQISPGSQNSPAAGQSLVMTCQSSSMTGQSLPMAGQNAMMVHPSYQPVASVPSTSPARPVPVPPMSNNALGGWSAWSNASDSTLLNHDRATPTEPLYLGSSPSLGLEIPVSPGLNRAPGTPLSASPYDRTRSFSGGMGPAMAGSPAPELSSFAPSPSMFGLHSDPVDVGSLPLNITAHENLQGFPTARPDPVSGNAGLFQGSPSSPLVGFSPPPSHSPSFSLDSSSPTLFGYTNNPSPLTVRSGQPPPRLPSPLHSKRVPLSPMPLVEDVFLEGLDGEPAVIGPRSTPPSAIGSGSPKLHSSHGKQDFTGLHRPVTGYPSPSLAPPITSPNNNIMEESQFVSAGSYSLFSGEPWCELANQENAAGPASPGRHLGSWTPGDPQQQSVWPTEQPNLLERLVQRQTGGQTSENG